MRNAMFGLLAATVGLTVSRIGQGVMSTDWDGLWAFVGLFSLMGGIVIATSAPVERALARVSNRRR